MDVHYARTLEDLGYQQPAAWSDIGRRCLRLAALLSMTIGIFGSHKSKYTPVACPRLVEFGLPHAGTKERSERQEQRTTGSDGARAALLTRRTKVPSANEIRTLSASSNMLGWIWGGDASSEAIAKEHPCDSSGVAYEKNTEADGKIHSGNARQALAAAKRAAEDARDGCRARVLVSSWHETGHSLSESDHSCIPTMPDVALK